MKSIMPMKHSNQFQMEIAMQKKHWLIMLACCLIPVIGFALVSVFELPLRPVFYFEMLILCPISHLLMMKFMGHGHNAPDKPASLTTTGRVVDDPTAERCH
jgi:cytochrome b561